MNTMGTSPQSTGPSTDQLTKALGTTLATADTSVASAAANLKLVHQARLSQLTRTAAALKAQYGAGDSRVVSAEAAVTARAATVARISMAGQQAATPAPAVVAPGWALHGRVYNAQLQPAAGLTVFLVDSKKAFQEQYGFVYTNDTGYFLLNYVPPAGQAAASVSLYVEIANQKAEPVYLATTAFRPAAGSTTYQNITLPAGEKPLGDPPPEIRKIAMPRQPSGS
jgi:hypothetical protein